MKKNYIKWFSSILAIVLVFSALNLSVFAEEKDGNNGRFEVIHDDDQSLTVKGYYEEGELTATLDRETSEVTLTSVEYPNNFLKIGEDQVNEYKAEITTLDPENGDVDAVLTNVETNEQIKLYTEGEKVEAQLPALVPLIEWAGGALLSYLAAHAVSITIAGVTAYAITELSKNIKKSKYNYWPAWIRNNDVYVGADAFKTDGEAFKWISSNDSGEYNLWAKTKSKAEEAARKRSGSNTATAHGAHEHKDGYYDHFHPCFFNIQAGKPKLYKNHIWYQ